MWVRFLTDTEGSKRGDVVFTEDNVIGQELIDQGIVAQCLGPNGVAFGEAAPEDVQAVLDAEAQQEALKESLSEGGDN